MLLSPQNDTLGHCLDEKQATSLSHSGGEVTSQHQLFFTFSFVFPSNARGEEGICPEAARTLFKILRGCFELPLSRRRFKSRLQQGALRFTGFPLPELNVYGATGYS